MPELRDYISNIEFATSLRELRSAVVDAYDFMGQQDLGDLDDYVDVGPADVRRRKAERHERSLVVGC